MERSRSYPFMLIRIRKGNLNGLIALQVDDSLRVCSKEFLEDEEQHSHTFKSMDCKGVTVVGKEHDFNGRKLRSE